MLVEVCSKTITARPLPRCWCAGLAHSPVSPLRLRSPSPPRRVDRELVLEVPHGTDTNFTQALQPGSLESEGGIGRRRRAGPRRRRAALDCVYHGTTASGSYVSLSACELPLKVHATIHASSHAESFELQPLDDRDGDGGGGGHVAFYIADLADNTTHSCGNSPSPPPGTSHAGARSHGDPPPAHRPHHRPHSNATAEAGAEHWTFGEPTDRSRRQTCIKTVRHTQSHHNRTVCLVTVVLQLF